jgi:hypothetical protein
MGTEFKRVELPFTTFSDDWDDSTGKLTKTCQDNTVYCPDIKTLKNMKTLSFWGEGVGGEVHLEIEEVGVMGC